LLIEIIIIDDTEVTEEIIHTFKNSIKIHS